MDYFVGYIGTYTKGAIGRGKGIYSFKLDRENGRVENLRLAAACTNPSYLALSPSKRYLYGVNEIQTQEGNPQGMLSAFRVEPETGDLTFLNQHISHGRSPCHIAINPGGTHGVVANYMSGTLSVFPLEPGLGEAVQIIQLTGKGPNPERQEGPHAHFFMFDPQARFGFACDLGSDRVMSYGFHAQESTPLLSGAVPGFSSKPGAGPRHGVFHPSGNWGYVVNELDSTVDVLRYNGAGEFEGIQHISTLPADTQVFNTTAAIKISPEGRFLYASNRGHDSIAVYEVRSGGDLALRDILPSGGKTPRDFTMDPAGNFLLVCHQDSDNMVVFRIDQPSGLFKKVQEYEVPSGVCVLLS